MRILGLAALVGLALIGLLGCGTDRGGGPTHTRLRYVNLVDDSILTQLYWMGLPVSPRNLEYREDSGYQSMDSGRSTVDLYAVNIGNLDSESQWLLTDMEYTIFGVGAISNGSAQIVKVDDDTRPAVDQTKVRVFHGSPAAGTFDVYVTLPNTDLVDVLPNYQNVSFTQVTPYINVNPGSFRVRLTVPNTKDVIIDTGTIENMAGQVYTVCAIGNPGVGQPIRSLTLIDRR